MRTAVGLAASIAWAVVCAVPTAAHEHGHGGCHGLCHHWENPIYAAEMRLQMLAMAAVVAAIVVWNLTARLRTRTRGRIGA